MSTPFGDNPFAMLTLIMAPAILTSAMVALSLSTGNRVGRVLDRSKEITRELEGMGPGGEPHRTRVRQLERLQQGPAPPGGQSSPAGTAIGGARRSP